MAGSLVDERLTKYYDLELVAEDCFGKVFKGFSLADRSQVFIRLLDTPLDKEACRKAIDEADKEDFLTDIEIVDEKMLVTHTEGFEHLSELNKIDIDHTLPMAEFEALGIIGAVLPKLLKVEKAGRHIFNLRPSNLFVKRICEGRPDEGKSSHTLKIGEPYQHILFNSAETVSDAYVPQNYKLTAENLYSHSLGCLMHHLAFGEAMGSLHRENNTISYLYSHYMFQLTKSNPRERLNLAGFERSQRTLKDCAALVIYPTSSVTNLLLAKGYYTGEIRYGEMHGKGTYNAHRDSYASMDVAESEGFYCMDKLHFQATIVYRSGDRYEGSVQWDVPHGEGTLVKLSGSRFSGEWEGSYLVEDSEAEIIIPDYSCYRGQVSKNQANGRGLMIYNDGLVYKGDFKQNQRHGTGEMFRKDGDTLLYHYVGSWYENEKHGEGEETIEDKIKYKGNFHMGKKHGQGKLVNSDENWTYEGEFKNDHFHGLGGLDYTFGPKYNGEFKAGKKHGYGCSENPDGSSYDGQWENDKQHGDGSLTDPEGNTTVGVWLSGEQVDYED